MVANPFKRFRVAMKRFFVDSWAEWKADYSKSRWLVRTALFVFLLGFLFLVGLGMFWSFEPDAFDVRQNAKKYADSHNQKVVVGTTTAATLIEVVRILLEKPGGYLSNDIAPPGVWLDNIPNWEYGALVQVRDLSNAMRDRFSHSQSQSKEDPDLGNAEPQFNFDHDSWWLPASESKYREGVAYMDSYLQRLADEDATDAQFFARADNLSYWLRTVETRLGSLSQRLSASVGQRRLNTDLAGDESAVRSTRVPGEEWIKTPRFEVDDVFFEARGASWALMQFLKAVEVDFADVLEKKNARVSLQQIIRELEAAQQPVYSPIILNGGGYGFFANHSLVLASYISRANAAIIDLRELLTQG